ncbi:hypothetical protein M4D81_32525 [Paenibacillus sp. p3-SID867]|uniref:hypothetical protein n=1 Tax=Paenibacillus sp. p3-SID867 TaxID=2916363 RepID=UPI0021A95084|nr:hypothetical protein [Paenibacillus sp. p3-SID867]MCT1403732.1 hypothetical protein [Paenibacillus sp. p3-SID867]
MLKKRHITLILLVLLTLLTAFSKQDPIVISDVEINVMKIAGILRYDIVLKKTAEFKLDDINETNNSPGHVFNEGLNFAVRPNNNLASLMELESNKKYVKMQLRGGGSSGNFDTEGKTTLNLEYSIKKDVDIDEVGKSALDSTLLVLMGNKVIAEIPLNKVK